MKAQHQLLAMAACCLVAVIAAASPLRGDPRGKAVGEQGLPVQDGGVQSVACDPKKPGDLKDRQVLEACVQEFAAEKIMKPDPDDPGENVAGVTIAIVDLTDPAAPYVLTRGFGCANAKTLRPIDADKTLFRVGSVSKLVAATAILQLAEKGILGPGSLDEVLRKDVNEFLPPRLAFPATYPEPVRLINLLTHTAGLEENQAGFLINRELDETPLEDMLAAHKPARIRPPAVDFNSGRDASYSSWGIALLGHIVALRSNEKSFDAYVEKNIFGRLGMGHSTFREYREGEWPDWASDMAAGHEFKPGASATKTAPPVQLGLPLACAPRPDGVFEPRAFEYLHSLGPMTALSTTAADMAMFMMAHLRDEKEHSGPRLLASATAQRMHSRILVPHPYEEFNGAGLGFYEIHRNGRRVISHSGSTVWFASKFMLLPEEHIGIFIAMNSPAPDIRMRNFMTSFVDKYFPRATQAGSQIADSVGQYAGVYIPSSHSYTRNEKSLALFDPENFTVRVEPGASSTLRIHNLFTRTSDWAQIGPGLFRRVRLDGEKMVWTQEAAAFFGDKGEVRGLLGPEPFHPALRLARHETPGFHLALLERAKECFLLAIVVALAWAVLRPRLGAAWYALLLAAAVGIFNLVALEILADFFSNRIAVVYGYTALVYVALTLLLLSVFMTIGVLCFSVVAWLKRYWTPWGRLLYTLFALVAVAFLWSMNFWNLIGFKMS